MFRPCGHNHCPLEGKHTKLLNKSLNGNCLQTGALQTYITKWQQTPNPLVNYPIWHFSIDSYSPIKTCTFVPCFLLRVIFSITYLINNVKALRPENGHVSVLRREIRASIVVQGFSIHLAMQGTLVRSLVLEDPMCRGAAKPMRHNYWTHALQLLKPTCLEPVLSNKRSHCNEKPVHHNKE